ncbi:3-mercaptopyruvate sulfurtransferase [Acidimicrobium ferrooxidans DSM 10331]|uniref:3-mercaptopyruvate sulfurtransferase n=1 Tax=Acidimicrobium ferrooxidans (strain DSM 10331 / JCM 15462 / NBRC 103882 / ICP) TaxID=525909 RepID=C7M2A8_ACIFD|nr:rhodanese-like domain-containing protein [Acidimicrobium ferrooxidans]ACU54897.1 3-mercaptopyruvate sulfurtransferase [Acidimicrobium ferrooxidans DSM 10331]
MSRDPILAPTDLSAELQILDVRWRLGTPVSEHRARYDAGHVPGAIFVDLEAVGTGAHRPGAGRHPLPEPGQVARDLAALGVDLGAPCVVVDDARGASAARLWWLLDALGVEAYLLDGGLEALEGPRCQDPCDRRAAATPRAVPATWPGELVLDVDTLADQLNDPSLCVLDARARERYLGQSEPIDPRAGHIPGARSLPIDEVLATGRFPDPATARRILGPVGDREIVASCGSGITACVLIALARRAGRDARLLEGSWSGWCEDPARPVCRSVCGDELTRGSTRTNS